MRVCNPHYFNVCVFSCKFLLLLICAFTPSCSRQNDTKQILSADNQIQISASAININTASAAELEKLPNVGAKTAQEIIEHRVKYGNFSQPEHLMLVRGISDERFRELRNLVKVE